MSRRVEVKVVGRKAVVIAEGLMTEDIEALNGLFDEELIFKQNEECDTVVIRSTSLKSTAVHIAAELEDRGFPWKNPQYLGCKVHPTHLQQIASTGH